MFGAGIWTHDHLNTSFFPLPLDQSSRLKLDCVYFLKNGPTSASFLFIFVLFKQTLQFLQQIYVKNVHPVYGAGIQTHDLRNVSLFP